jgi:amino acid transporter
VIKQALGQTTGKVFLVDSAIAITVCTLAVETACIRLLFAMARDGRLPFGRQIARVAGRSKVPIIPALVVGILALALLAINVGNQSAFLALINVAIIMFYLAYLGITAPLLVRRLRGQWPRPEHGRYFSLGRWGVVVNAFAVLYGLLVAVNIAWPRSAIYDSLAGTKDAAGKVIPAHWYWRWIAELFIGAVIVIGALYYVSVYRRKPIEVIESHRADAQFDLRTPAALGEMAP